MSEVDSYTWQTRAGNVVGAKAVSVSWKWIEEEMSMIMKGI